MDQLGQILARSPELFPLALDLGGGTVTFIRLSEAEYEAASFLDGRIATGCSVRAVSWPQLFRAVEESGLTESCHFIFHIGHVGSTLLSRLLGKHEQLFALREPEILRTLALARDCALLETHLPLFLKLWSRVFGSGQTSLVKATSFTSDLAAPVLARANQPKALLLGVKIETYLATIFGGANAPAEAKALAPFRAVRLGQRLGCAWSVEKMSLGEIIAMSWACEALALAETALAADARARVLDFDSFLARPREVLAQAFAHFDISIGDRELEPILSGKEMRTYSKAPEHEYDSQLRAAVLAQGRVRHGPEIRRGLLWLEHTADDFPQLRSALNLFE